MGHLYPVSLAEGHPCQEATLSFCLPVELPALLNALQGIGTKVQGLGSCVGSRAWQQGDPGEKLEEKGSGRKSQEGKGDKGDLCLMGKEVAICHCPNQPAA